MNNIISIEIIHKKPYMGQLLLTIAGLYLIEKLTSLRKDKHTKEE